jgi:hypothetical protein
VTLRQALADLERDAAVHVDSATTLSRIEIRSADIKIFVHIVLQPHSNPLSDDTRAVSVAIVSGRDLYNVGTLRPQQIFGWF